jgi:mRNA interferase RelE/StbE
MEVILKKSFIKEVKRLPNYLSKACNEIVNTLEKAENLAATNLDYKIMEGQKKGENYVRIRVGGYRIGAELIEPNIILITVGSRNDIYKTFPPK